MLQLCKNATALTVFNYLIFTVSANFLLKYVQEKIVIKNQNLIFSRSCAAAVLVNYWMLE